MLYNILYLQHQSTVFIRQLFHKYLYYKKCIIHSLLVWIENNSFEYSAKYEKMTNLFLYEIYSCFGFQKIFNISFWHLKNMIKTKM